MSVRHYVASALTVLSRHNSHRLLWTRSGSIWSTVCHNDKDQTRRVQAQRPLVGLHNLPSRQDPEQQFSQHDQEKSEYDMVRE